MPDTFVLANFVYAMHEKGWHQQSNSKAMVDTYLEITRIKEKLMSKELSDAISYINNYNALIEKLDNELFTEIDECIVCTQKMIHYNKTSLCVTKIHLSMANELNELMLNLRHIRNQMFNG